MRKHVNNPYPCNPKNLSRAYLKHHKKRDPRRKLTSQLRIAYWTDGFQNRLFRGEFDQKRIIVHEMDSPDLQVAQEGKLRPELFVRQIFEEKRQEFLFEAFLR